MRLEVECPGMAGRAARVWIDGVCQTDVISITVDMRADSFNRVTMTRILDDLSLDIKVADEETENAPDKVVAGVLPRAPHLRAAEVKP